MRRETHFFLNDREIRTEARPGMLVLDFLRNDRGLTGTKEGCREGDCGACAVLVGELSGARVRYKSVTSCLMPVGELHGKHLVSIEGLNVDRLTAVQQAIVDEGATQCGFCTPGIVVSMTGYLMDRDQPADLEGVKATLGGHLCRCTGYRSLKASARLLQHALGNEVGLTSLVREGQLPEYFEGMAARLASISSLAHTEWTNGSEAAYVIAGGTDLYVQQGNAIPTGNVVVLSEIAELKGIEETATHVDIGALTTFEEFAQSAVVQGIIPGIKDYMFLIASVQIRNRATLGGNIVNASPIADLTILLLSMDTEILLTNGSKQRSMRLSEFYKGYKQIDLRPGEVLSRIRIAKPQEGTRLNWEKVSKRKCLDIATVNSAMRIRLDDGFVRDAAVAVGGVAPVPLLLSKTSSFLQNKHATVDTVLEAERVAQGEIVPISDIRGSADYKRLLTRQLLMAHFIRLFPDRFSADALYAAS